MRPQETSRRTPADSPHVAPAKPTARSRVTNGKRLHASGDGRTREARRWRDLFREHMTITGGKHEQLCRSLASCIVRREAIDAAVARGEDVDVIVLVRISGECRRLLARLDLVAPAHDATDEIIAGIRSRAAEAAR